MGIPRWIESEQYIEKKWKFWVFLFLDTQYVAQNIDPLPKQLQSSIFFTILG